MLIQHEGDRNDERKLHIVDLFDEILSKINESSEWFVTFVALLSPNIWKSASELAEAWITMVAREEYEELLKADNDLEVEKFKRMKQENLLLTLNLGLFHFSQNPTGLQKLTSRLLVMEALVSELPVYDQDRIIAKHLWLPYRTWQGIMWLLVNHPEFLHIFQKTKNTISSGILDDGTTIYSMAIRHQDYRSIKSLEMAVPGFETAEVAMVFEEENENGSFRTATENVSVILINQNVLRRYEDILQKGREYDQVRECVDQKFGKIPTWKKRSLWGGKPKEAEEYGLMPVSARR